MLCNFTHAVRLFNSEVPSVINKVAARRKKQNNYFFNIQVLIMIPNQYASVGIFSLWTGDLRAASPHFPMNVNLGT